MMEYHHHPQQHQQQQHLPQHHSSEDLPQTAMSTPSSSRTAMPFMPQQQPLYDHSAYSYVPIPPARTSSLAVPSQQPTSPDSANRVPSVQVIQPTPTKRRSRRKSEGEGTSPVLNKMYLDMDEDEDSDIERARLEEEKRARVREKGRERQRRKRERDKKAKEDKIATGHLPIPSKNRSQTSLTTLMSTHPLIPHSAPSSTSSTFSSLPLSSNYYSVSPSLQGTASTSGQSSPNTLFSPAISTPGIGYDPVWASESHIDMRRKSRGSNSGRGRGLSMTSRRGSQDIFMSSLETQARPEKRRKSDSQDEYKQVGLGVIMGDGSDLSIMERPKPRRSHSDFLPSTDWSLRSPTPPPVPSVPSEYRNKSKPATSNGKASFFASVLLLALDNEANSGLIKILESELDVNRADLEKMRGDIEGVYDKWKKEKAELESRLSQVSLEEKDDTTSRAKDTYATPTAAKSKRNSDANSNANAGTTTPSRVRSLSSTSQLSRGLVINSSQAEASKWETPPVQKTSSDSPTIIQTPGSAPAGTFDGWKPVDTATIYDNPEWYQHPKSDSMVLESPLTMTATTATATTAKQSQSQIQVGGQQQGQMAPPNPIRDPPQTQTQWGTAYAPFTPSSRIALRAPVPFTPPTPMPLKGGEAPMWYQQAFLQNQMTPADHQQHSHLLHQHPQHTPQAPPAHTHTHTHQHTHTQAQHQHQIPIIPQTAMPQTAMAPPQMMPATADQVFGYPQSYPPQ